MEGTILLTCGTSDLLQVEGLLVKRPSFWTRKVHIVRDYARIAGARVPVATGVDRRRALRRRVDVLDVLRVRDDQRRGGDADRRRSGAALHASGGPLASSLL